MKISMHAMNRYVHGLSTIYPPHPPIVDNLCITCGQPVDNSISILSTISKISKISRISTLSIPSKISIPSTLHLLGWVQ